MTHRASKNLLLTILLPGDTPILTQISKMAEV
jgi:hypothetical protein